MIASVLVDINLPQVDRLFDFSIPEALLPTIRPGQRVRVEYGRSNKPTDGFVVSLADISSYTGELRNVTEIVSPAAVLRGEIYEFIRAIADRQVASAAELVKNAVPTRSVKVENAWIEQSALNSQQIESSESIEEAISKIEATLLPWVVDAQRTANLAEFGAVEVTGANGTEWHPRWALNVIHSSLKTLEKGKSSIVCLPDFRDLEAVRQCAKNVGADGLITYYESSVAPSKRYSSFLEALEPRPRIVVGNRSAIYAPVRNLGLIVVWDDDDESFYDQSSPYCSLRDLALIRQEQADCNLILAAHSRSVEVQRMVEIGYLSEGTAPVTWPKISTSEATSRISPSVFSIIKKALSVGPVLVQVSAIGQSTSLFCANCNDRAQCSVCRGPLWVNASGHNQCRWCSALNDSFRCGDCGNSKLRAGKPGSARTLEQFGTMLPNVPLREFTGESSEFNIDEKPRLIVATPGAEPYAAVGYAAVVILDAQDMLARDTISATSDALRLWLNAIAKVRDGGDVLVAGLDGPLGETLISGELSSQAANELAERRELDFPPAVRIASVEGERALLSQFSDAIDKELCIDVLGPTPVSFARGPAKSASDIYRLILRFRYSQGALLALHLRELSTRLGAGQKRTSLASGRAVRPIKIKMDDRSVL